MSGDRLIQNDFGGVLIFSMTSKGPLCKKLSFFTIETAKTDASIQDNLVAPRRLHERKTERMGHCAS